MSWRHDNAFEFDTTMSLGRVEAVLCRMEKHMSAETDALDEIKAKLADLHADVKAALNAAAGELSEEGKASIAQVVSAIDAFDAEIGDAPAAPETDPAVPVDPSTPAEDATPPAV